jgi:hypothetical protein
LLVALVVVGATVSMVRRGRFRPRVVLELLVDKSEGSRASFAITANGQALQADVKLGYRSQERQLETSGTVPNVAGLERVTLQLPKTCKELKVWVHRVTPEGTSESLPALVQVKNAATNQEFELGQSDHVILPLPSGETQVVINLVNSRNGAANL